MEHFIEQAIANYDFGHLYMHIFIYMFVFIIPVVACVLDLGSGILAAKKNGEALQSHRLRKTIEKIVIYLLLAVLIFFIELFGTLFPQYTMPFIGIVYAVGVGLVEGKSMVENARKMKHGLADVPNTLKGFTAVLGEADVKRILADAAKKKLEQKLLEEKDNG